MLRSAKSLFSERAMASYSIVVPRPVADAFKGVLPLREPRKRPILPTAEALRMAVTQLPAHPRHWRAFLLAACCGLRAGEIIAARKSWIRDGLLYVGGTDEFQAKDADWRVVHVDPAIVPLLLAGDDDSLVGRNVVSVVSRELVAMLRGYGFPHKPLQALRRLAGSMVNHTSGMSAARDFLGHSSVAVTERYYARELAAPPAISLLSLRESPFRSAYRIASPECVVEAPASSPAAPLPSQSQA